MNNIKSNFILLILLFILLPSYVICQSNGASKTQFFDQKYKISKNNLIHNDTATFRMIKESPMIITKTKGDSIFINLMPKREVDVPDNGLLSRVEKTNEVYYILISEGADKLKFTDFDVSPLVIPLKIRPALDNNPLQFLGDVAIGPYFGYQRGTKSLDNSNQTMTQTSFTLCMFGSPTLININPTNQIDTSLSSSSVLGISAGLGILVDINNVRFGVVGGWDWISGTASQTWDYQGKQWASFSFAYNLSNQ